MIKGTYSLGAYLARAFVDVEVGRFRVPTEDAAAFLGVSGQRVRQLVAAGKLDAVAIALRGRTGYLFDREELEERKRTIGTAEGLACHASGV